MKTIFFFLSFAGAVLLCGCGKQEKINSQKIDALSQKIDRLQQLQSNQTVVLQSQLNDLAPALNQIDSDYYEKNRDAALFFHTNTLYLLLTIGKRIESQLGAAASDRQEQNVLAYSYQTNQLNELYLCTAQIQTALHHQESRIEDTVTVQIARANVALSNALSQTFSRELSNQTRTLMPDAAEIARRRRLEAEINQIQNELQVIKARLETTNAPGGHP